MPQPFVLEDGEKRPLALLNSAVEINSDTPAHLTPSPHVTYRRYPTPILLSTLDDSVNIHRFKCLLTLYAHWSVMLVLFPECLLYKGDDASAEAFRRATSQTPSRFARGFLEAEGSSWRGFHAKSTGKAVLDALLEIWQGFSKKWRNQGNEKIFKFWCERLGSTDLSYFEGEKRMLNRIVITSLAPLQAASRELFCALKPNGSFDCEVHQTTPSCTCFMAKNQPVIYQVNTVMAMFKVLHATLMGNDEAFLYVGDTASAQSYKDRTGETVEEFAKDLYVNTTEGFGHVWVPYHSEAEVVQAILRYWGAYVKRWRQNCKTLQEARTKEHQQTLEKEDMHMIEDMDTMIPRRMGPREDLGSDDPMVRVVDFGPVGHQYTAVTYPKLMDDGNFQWDVVRFIPCHEGPQCASKGNPYPAAFRQALLPFLKEDLAKAKAVKPDW